MTDLQPIREAIERWRWNDFKERIGTVEAWLRTLLARVDELEAEAEQLRVQLAGCGVIAGCNTRESLARHTVTRGTYGHSASFDDVVSAVTREIELREKCEQLEAINQRNLGLLEALEAEGVRREMAEDENERLRTALKESSVRNEDVLRVLEQTRKDRDAAEQRCKALEAERDDQRARILQLIGERDGYRHQAGVKWALRREIEQMLGIPDGPCSDPQLEAGVTALRAIVAERDRLKAELDALRRQLAENETLREKAWKYDQLCK